MSVTPALRSQVETWIADDPDADTRAELQRCWPPPSPGTPRRWPTSRTGSAGAWSSAPPDCAAR